MRKIRDGVDRFCARHPRFGIPNLMLYVAVGTVAVFLLQLLTRNADASALDFLSFTLAGLLRGEVWRLVTFLFVPDSANPLLLMISLYFYYWVGSTLERQWGVARFTVYYLSGALLSVLSAVILSLVSGSYEIPMAGTHYVNLSMFLAFAVLFPDAQVLLLFVIPVKMKWLAYLDGALIAYEMISGALAGSWLSVVLPVVALLNFVVFVWPELERLVGTARRRVSPRTVQFRRAVHRQEQEKGYHHKCAVCGRTDADYPELTFRYCSKCAGYHCFCQDHLFTHVHFTE